MTPIPLGYENCRLTAKYAHVSFAYFASFAVKFWVESSRLAPEIEGKLCHGKPRNGKELRHARIFALAIRLR